MPSYQFNMYNSYHSQDQYCLLYYVSDNDISEFQSFVVAHEIIPYCLRPSKNNYIIPNFTFNNTIDLNFTFSKLREQNISSQLLLSWSASIDLAEEYEIFLNNISQSSLSPSKEISFYNCTLPWFGPFCSFAFDLRILYSFNEVISLNFEFKTKTEQVPCYEHLNCKTSGVCLDWHEICDRKIDCFGGIDEVNCWLLEINECAENEYRCHNGQCIPKEFFHDVPLNPDCMDRTDEPVNSVTETCRIDPAFRCEEHTCRPGNEEFPCGDGQCSSEGTSECSNGREKYSFNDSCLASMSCVYYNLPLNYELCEEFCPDIYCAHDNCPSLYEFPPGPGLFGHIRFMFKKKTMKVYAKPIPLPDYVCYNEQLCAAFFPATVYLNGSSCRHFAELELKTTTFDRIYDLFKNIKDRFRGCLVLPNSCDHSTMYRCLNSSKCISKYRLVDGIRDCPFDDDENFNENCSLKDIRFRFNCSMNVKKKCFAPLTILDEKKDCDDGEEERIKNDLDKYYQQVYFPRICDGYPDLLPIIIDGQNETDETDCENKWPCNNTYTRCDQFWSCQNGADEINCSPSMCPPLEHSCVMRIGIFYMSCLPISRVGDGIVDCFGASDERHLCQPVFYPNYFEYRFKCRNSTCIDSGSFCDDRVTCLHGDDEFCEPATYHPICTNLHTLSVDSVSAFLCHSFGNIKRTLVYFKLQSMSSYPFMLITDTVSLLPLIQTKTQLIHRQSISNTKKSDVWLCNRGLPIHIRQTNKISKLFCLCPPSYYGDRCQFQNERVSLTIQIRVSSDWYSLFTFIIILIDNEANIESFDHIDYLPTRDCATKFNIYLLYSTRPKNRSKNYSVRIDAFNKVTLNYRASWIHPLRFPFLPVERLAILLRVPFSDAEPVQRCAQPCIHGQCFNYANDPRSTFCGCSPGWSGPQCSIEYSCDCASGSLCIDKSICVCSVERFGPRCHLFESSCQSDTCANGSRCVPSDERYAIVQPTCICSEEYLGDKCERPKQIRIDISFDKKVNIPPFLFVHFITIQNQSEPIRASLMKRIGFDQNLVTFYTSITFNMALAQMFNDYYLIILREQAIISAIISTQIIPSHRCLSINELFNETFAKKHLLKRIKSYHIPCQKQLELVCFYDEKHFCLCDLKRHANCFEFNHSIAYDCRGFNYCENEGLCFVDNLQCPTSSLCACPECYFGSRCQISTSGSTLTFDAILGYQIRPNIPINQQYIAVKVAIGLTSIIFILGCINSVLSFMTFQKKITRNIGCGVYLFASSIVSIMIISVLTIKFWLLFASHTGSVQNRTFLYLQCASIDFLLRLLMSTSDWLSACIAIERTVNVLKGANFSKTKSKQMAKWIILIVILFTSCTYIHDPIHRHLIDDQEEQRLWCITKYSSSLKMFDWTVNILHFSALFVINCISPLIIITTVARTRSNAQKKQTYKDILHDQFQQHKHLLISPIILVLLALPRLIISFLSGCMKSARNPWIYLFGYFISFIPPVLTFVVFVLPSKVYKGQLKDTVNRLRRIGN